MLQTLFIAYPVHDEQLVDPCSIVYRFVQPRRLV